DGAIEREGALVARRAAIELLGALPLAANADGMLSTEPSQRVADLIDVAVLAENVRGGQTEVAGYGDVRHLRRENAGIDGAEVGKLCAVGHADQGIVAIEADAELIEQPGAEGVSIMKNPVVRAQRLCVGGVGRDVATLKIQAAIVAKESEIHGVLGTENVIATDQILGVVARCRGEAHPAAVACIVERQEPVHQLDRYRIKARRRDHAARKRPVGVQRIVRLARRRGKIALALERSRRTRGRQQGSLPNLGSLVGAEQEKLVADGGSAG